MERPGAPHLSRPRQALIGREDELAELRHLLDHPPPRLITLTGPGGCGKTRLALELAQTEPATTWWIGLAPVSDSARVLPAVAAALGLREQSDRPLEDAVVDALAAQPGLLVLDNCEHLVAETAAFADRALDACPALRILATSREVLGVRGETAWHVPPLANESAVRLFVERAHATRRTFVLGADNAPTVAELCRRLDGLPLAIELAAARVNVLGVDQILAQLVTYGPLLDSRVRGTSPRQQTLRATIDWSYDLLEESEGAALRAVSVFAGGWSIEAAAAVCDGDAVDLLARLADKSLVLVDERHGQTRFRLLETIRQYALERLLAAGDEPAARQRHARYYAVLARRAAVGLCAASPATWLALLEDDLDNLRASLAWLAEQQPPRALEMAAALWWLWFRTGLWHEGRAWLERLLDATDDAEPARTEALLGRGVLAWAQGALSLAEASLESSIARSGPPERGLALQFLAMDVLAQGDVPRARVLVEQAVDELRPAGGSIALALALASRGVVDLSEHDPTAARAPLEESVDLLRALDDPWGLALPLRNLGIVAFQTGDLERADSLVRESLAVLADRRDPWFVSRSLETLAMIAAARGQSGRAARLFGAGEALRARVGAAVLPFYQSDYDRGVGSARTALGAAAFANASAAGRAMRIDQALAYALEPERPPRARLSAREQEVLTLIARGLSNRGIAEALVITEKTAEAHVSAVLRKLDLDSRAQAAVWAVEHGHN